MRRFWLIVAFLAITALSSSTTWIALRLSDINRRPDAALLRGLNPSGWQQPTPAFEARVRQRFPPGTPEAAIFRELNRQGFHALWPHALQPGEHGAYLSWGGLPCRHAAELRWRPDAQGRVNTIQAWIRQTSCL